MFSRFTLSLLAAAGLVLAADLEHGKQLYQQGKYAEAETELQAAAKENPENAAAHLYLGLALLGREKTAEAAEHIRKADELASSGETKLGLAKLYVAQKNLDEAETAIKEASGDELEYVRGLIHLHRDRFKEAADDLEAYLAKRPEDAYAHYYAGLAYNNLKQPDKMLSHFETFVRLKPDAPEARKVRAVLKTGR